MLHITVDLKNLSGDGGCIHHPTHHPQLYVQGLSMIIVPIIVSKILQVLLLPFNRCDLLTFC